MSLVTLFTKKAPTIAGITFDAVLEDTFESQLNIRVTRLKAGRERLTIVLFYRFVGRSSLRYPITRLIPTRRTSSVAH